MIVAALFVLLFMFANAIDDNGRYCTTKKLGNKTEMVVEHKYYIPKSQCLGKLYTVPDPVCSKENTRGVSVMACDHNGYPTISLSDFLDYSSLEFRHYANITRYNAETFGMCTGTANVTLKIYCGVLPGPYFLPFFFLEDKKLV